MKQLDKVSAKCQKCEQNFVFCALFRLSNNIT